MRRHLGPLLRRTWIPLTLALVLVVGVMLVLPWYYKTFRGATPDRGLTATELEWVRGYGPWRTRVGETLARAHANRNSVDGELGRILGEIADCGDDLRVQVGTPGSERLVPAAEAAAAACTSAAAALEEYRAAGDTPSWRTSAMLAGARDAVRRAEVHVRQLLLAQRPLPERSGRDEESSRIEPRLSDGISAGQPAEVLCWSEDEWPQVRAELAALGLERDRTLSRDVNAYRFRVHASPGVCGPLVRFAYDESPAPTPEVSRALIAVLHAAQHAVAGVDGEAAAACEAARRVPQAAARLGALPAAAQAVVAHVRDTAVCSR